MTQEEKAKKYDEVVCKLRRFMEQGIDPLITRADVQDFFPELCESEDEKIRKVLKHYLEVRRCQTQSDEEYINCNNFLAWLEKQGTSYTKKDVDDAYVEGMAFAKDELERQGEQKPVDNVGSKFKVGDWCIDNEDGTIFQIVKVLDNTYTYKTNEGSEYSCTHYSLENDSHLWTIQDARLGDVLACNEEILLFKSYSVQGRISLYCWYNGQTNNFHSKEVVDTLMTTRNKIYPATKEQRDLLFQKMKEAGYTFDFEKKELKKIEQPELTEFEEAVKDMIDDYRDAIDAHAATTEEVKERAAYMLSLIPHKSAEWSEEDKKMVKCCEIALEAFEKLGKNTQDFPHENYFELDEEKIYPSEVNRWLKFLPPQIKQEWSEEDEKVSKYALDIPQNWTKEDKERYISCLQRLSTGNPEQPETINSKWFKEHVYPQKQWKPSDAQIRALEYIIDNAHNTSYSCKIAKELLEQLRKLKGE